MSTPKNILLLGGTASLGRAISVAALQRNHTVTCVARGTESVVEGATLLPADRDADGALTVAAGTLWDAVIDLTRHPVHAERAVRDLRAEHWIFVSSASVYTGDRIEALREDAPLHPALAAAHMNAPQDYPGAKVACEDAYRAAQQDLTIVRPGLIGGWGDDTGRSGYYAWRFAHPTGPDVIVPDLSGSVSVVDAGDLAIWLVHCVEHRVLGTFNAAGSTVTLNDYVQASKTAAGSHAAVTAVDSARLTALGVTPWMGPRSLPLWIPGGGPQWLAHLDSSAAHQAGLKERPLSDLIDSALLFEEQRHGPRGAGLTDDEERALRAEL